MNALSLCQRVQRRNPAYDLSEYLDEINASYKETWDYILQLEDSYFTDVKIVTVTEQAAEFDFLYNSSGFLDSAVSFRAYQINRIRILQPGDTNWVKAAPRNWNDDDFQSLQQITPQPVANSGPYLYQLFSKFSCLFARPLPAGTQIEVTYSFTWLPLQIVSNGTIQTFSNVTDNFNRANANPVGSPWNAAVGSIQLLSNQVVASTTASQFNAILYNTNWPADQSSQATLRGLTHLRGYLALVLRSNANFSTAYYITLDGIIGGIGIATPFNIQKLVGGVLLGPPYHGVGYVTPQLGDIFKAQIIDDTISIFQNGNLIGSFIDPTPITNGSAGIFIQPVGAGVVTDLAWDDWVGGNPGGNGIIGTNTNFTQVVGADYISSLPGNDQDTDIGLELVLNAGANSQTYRVKTIDSDTSLSLVTAPTTAIPALTTYNLCTVPDIPDGHHNVISTIATRNFMSTPGNDARFTSWAALAEKELNSMRDSIMVRQRQEPARVRPFPQRLLRYTAFPNTR